MQYTREASPAHRNNVLFINLIIFIHSITQVHSNVHRIKRRKRKGEVVTATKDLRINGRAMSMQIDRCLFFEFCFSSASYSALFLSLYNYEISDVAASWRDKVLARSPSRENHANLEPAGTERQLLGAAEENAVPIFCCFFFYYIRTIHGWMWKTTE